MSGIGQSASKPPYGRKVQRLDERCSPPKYVVDEKLLLGHRVLMWSRRFNSCVSCGSTANKHYGAGRCSACYRRDWAASNKESIAARQHGWYVKQRDSDPEFSARARRNKNGPVDEAMAQAQNRCESCGAAEHLHVHHKDHRGSNLPKRDRNNSLENLQVLCRPCHGSLHGAVTGWSRKHAACVLCGTTDRPHHAHGHCAGCLHRLHNPKRTAWARYSGHVCCAGCGTTAKKHKGAGLCVACFERTRQRAKV